MPHPRAKRKTVTTLFLKKTKQLKMAEKSSEIAGITFQENAVLRKAIIENPEYADTLSQAFEALATAGITFKDNAAIYEAVINKSFSADKLPQASRRL